MDELRAIAARIRREGCRNRIDGFLDEYDMTEHEESACLYFLLGMIDAAGIKI